MNYTPNTVGTTVDLDAMRETLENGDRSLGAVVSANWSGNHKWLPVALENEFKGNRLGASIGIVEAKGAQRLKHFTNRFFLLGFTRSFKEKAQIMETMGSASFSFFGQSALVYQFQCAALEMPAQNESWQGMHFSTFQQFYNLHLRASELAKADQLAVLTVNNHMVYGYPLSLNAAQTGDNHNTVQFVLSWLVVKHEFNGEEFSEATLARGYSVSELLATEEKKRTLYQLDKKMDRIVEVTTLTVDDAEFSLLNQISTPLQLSQFLRNLSTEDRISYDKKAADIKALSNEFLLQSTDLRTPVPYVGADPNIDYSILGHLAVIRGEQTRINSQRLALGN